MLKTGPWLLGLVVVSFDDEKGPVIDFASPSSFLTAKLENDIKWISLPRETNHVHDSCFFVFRLRRDAEIPYSECSFQNHDYCYGYVYFQCHEDSSHKRGYRQESTVILSSLPIYGFYRNIVTFLGTLYSSLGSFILSEALECIEQWPFPSVHESYVLTLLENEFSVRIPNLPSVRRILSQTRSSIGSVSSSPLYPRSIETTHQGNTMKVLPGANEKVLHNPAHSTAETLEALPETADLITSTNNSSPNHQTIDSHLCIQSQHELDSLCLHDPSPTQLSPSPPLCGQSRDMVSLCEVCHVSDGIDGAFIDIPLLPHLLSFSGLLDILWAHLILSHSLLVFAPSASILSHSFLLLSSLLAPLELQLDLRPSLTVYDPDYPVFAAPSSPLSLLAGTTDPLVVETLSRHLDVLFLGEGPGECVEYSGPTGIKRIVTEVARGGYTILMQHDTYHRESWNSRFLNDLSAVLTMSSRVSETGTTLTESSEGMNGFLRSLIFRHTTSFLEPFQRCIRLFEVEAKSSSYHPYVSAAWLMRDTDEWRVEEWIHLHPEVLKYPFSEADSELLYRFSTSAQVTQMLRDMKRNLEQELTMQARSCVRMNREEFVRRLPRDPKGREAIRKRILSELEHEKRLHGTNESILQKQLAWLDST